MHPDKKVGLALGILLIGIVAALFFRNESPESDSSIVGKAEADEIDEKIRTKEQTPYLPEQKDESDDGVELAQIDEVDVAELMPEISGFGQLDASADVPEPIRFHPGPDLNGTDDGLDLRTPVPLPSADGAGLDEALQAAATQRNAAVSPGNGGALSAADSRAERKSAVYEVVSGDTLSGIASRHLGSHRHWKKLYDANRDVLTTPEKLRPGMKLRIPGTEAGRSTPQTAIEPKTPDAPRSKSLFEVPSRSPRRTVPRVSSRLTQQPPPGLPRVVGLEATVIASKPGDSEATEKSASEQKKDSE